MKPYFFLMLMILVAGSCTKKKVIVSENNTRDEIIIGDTTNMLVKVFDKEIVGYYRNPNNFEVDIDNDGLNDYRLSSFVYGWGPTGNHPVPCSSVSGCKNTDFLFGVSKTDTIFLNRTTVTTPFGNGIVYITKVTDYTCKRILP